MKTVEIEKAMRCSISLGSWGILTLYQINIFLKNNFKLIIIFIKENCHKYHIHNITFHVYTNHFYPYI